MAWKLNLPYYFFWLTRLLKKISNENLFYLFEPFMVASYFALQGINYRDAFEFGMLDPFYAF